MSSGKSFRTIVNPWLSQAKSKMRRYRASRLIRAALTKKFLIEVQREAELLTAIRVIAHVRHKRIQVWG